MCYSFKGYYLGGVGTFTPHQWCFFNCELPAGLPLLTTALAGLILGVVVWAVRSKQGDSLPLGEGLKVPFCYSRNTREKPVYRN